MTSTLFESLLQCTDCSQIHARAALIPSPFQSVIAHEILPSAAETAAIRTFIRDIDAEIASREATVNRLLCELTQLRRSSEKHKATIAPIRRVPTEILAEIFLQHAESEAHKEMKSTYYYDSCKIHDVILKPYHMVEPRPHRTPLIFGEICRKWRNVVLSLPHLWNSISLQCTNRKIERNIALCSMWLKRSGSLPLSIRFRREALSGREVTSNFIRWRCQDLIRILLPYANRLRFLDLDDLPLGSYDVLDELLPASVPKLEYLSIKHDRRYESVARMFAHGLTAWDRFRTAPKLTSLYFDNIDAAQCVHTSRENPTFPWSQLTHIHVGGCTPTDCIQILAQASTATACMFGITMDSAALQHTPIFNSQLRTLKIEAAVILHPFWNFFTSPLTTLHIEMTGEAQGPSSVVGLQQFLSRSGGAIQDFKLLDSGLRDEEFIACLRAMPLLRNLHISEDGMATQFTDRVWEALTLTSEASEAEEPPLIPNLEHLILYGQSFSHKSVVRMLRSRVKPTSTSIEIFPLKYMLLSTWRSMRDSAVERLRKFQDLGLDIEIEVHGDESADGSEASDTDN
ncbi:hypothetical protein B0H11DRAFT_161216 [Mycena galericulata]|nr:hypothetical protein B0H11DRAFT_161216 [Mycena galericulata]